MTDQIHIQDLAVDYHLGVPEAERAHPQRLLISLTLEWDFSKAGTTDDLRFTIDYFAVCQRLLGFGRGKSWKLLEKLACDMAAAVLREFHPRAVTIEIKKFIIPEANYVSVRIHRTHPQTSL